MITPLFYSMLGAGGPAMLMKSLRQLSETYKLCQRRLFHINQHTRFLDDRRQNSWAQKTKNKKRAAGTNIPTARKEGAHLLYQHGKVYFTYHGYKYYENPLQNLQIEGD